jgi:hypothetical protein
MGQRRRANTMPQFYFRQYINGRQMPKDLKGGTFAGPTEARTHAVRRAPGLLRKNLRPEGAYLSTEVSDDDKTRFIIRGKITSEKQ